MKPIPALKRNLIALSIAAIFMGHAAAATNANTKGIDGIVQTVGNVTYVSGGVGEKSLDKIGSMVNEFNLKLVFAEKSGAYLSAIQVVIVDAKGKPVLEATSEGPIFLAKLPAGHYQVSATSDGKTEKRDVSVGATKLSTMDFRWDAQ